jgi:hypothetical protein
MDRWYLLDPSSAQPAGPFTLDQMRSMAASGGLLGSSQVAKVGAAGWSPAASDPALAGLFGAAAPPVPPVAMPAAAGGRFTFGSAWELSLQTIVSRYVPLLLLALVIFGVNLPSQIASFLLNPTLTGSQPSPGVLLTGNCFQIVYIVLIVLPIAYGAIYAAAEVTQGRGSLVDIFMPFRRYGAALVNVLALLAISVACFLVAYLPLLVLVILGGAVGGEAGLGIGAVVGILLTLVAVLAIWAFVLIRIMYAPLIAIDPTMGSMGVADSFRFSWAATRGLNFPMLGFLIVGSLLSGLSILLLCVGYLVVGVPLFLVMSGSMYQLAIRNAPRT